MSLLKFQPHHHTLLQKSSIKGAAACRVEYHINLNIFYCIIIILLVQVRIMTEVLRTPSSTQPGSNSWPPDPDSTFPVTEIPAPTTRSSVTSA